MQKELSRQQLEFNESCVGKILPVLFEKTGKFDGQIVGKTPYMQSVYIDNADKSLIGKIVDVKIIKGLAISVAGEVI